MIGWIPYVEEYTDDRVGIFRVSKLDDDEKEIYGVDVDSYKWAFWVVGYCSDPISEIFPEISLRDRIFLLTGEIPGEQDGILTSLMELGIDVSEEDDK